jgi:hypothetical protein
MAVFLWTSSVPNNANSVACSGLSGSPFNPGLTKSPVLINASPICSRINRQMFVAELTDDNSDISLSLLI